MVTSQVEGAEGPAKAAVGEAAQQRAQAIFEAFTDFHARFRDLTRRAHGRFERREWRQMRADARERLGLYQQVIDAVVGNLRAASGAVADRPVWRMAKRRYCALIAGRDDAELAETFFNSVTRRIFATVGVDPEIEFIDSGSPIVPYSSRMAAFRSCEGAAEQIARDMLQGSGFSFADPEGDARRVGREIARLAEARFGSASLERVDILRPVFFRSLLAFLVARVHAGDQVAPLVVVLMHPPEGVRADAVLLGAEEVGPIFSLSRSYFHADAPSPGAVVAFLHSVLPAKSLAELYASIGQQRHGKTELYRHLQQHMAATSDLFEVARGERGLVMLVFTLPSLDLVFKVIRDRPGYPKNTSRAEVVSRYKLVFQHDRVGRLVDAQEFEQVRMDRRRFSPDLLADLLEQARSTVRVEEDAVVFRHIYTERKVLPLNLFVRERAEEEVRAAIADYGNAIKELAAVNIFPGDILLKNFGVKPDGRVVFYDYDELCLLTEVKFRELPQARDDSEEVSAEPWFYVNDNDVFPEEFPRFLGLEEPWRGLFLELHGDLFRPEFWRRMQALHESGEVLNVFPYKRHLARD